MRARLGISAAALAVSVCLAQLGYASTGDLGFQGCFADTAAEGCSVPGDPALGGAQGVAVSPNGQSVYVASQDDSSVSHFTRSAAGDLSYQGCFAESIADGCQVPFPAALSEARSVAVSPDGESVYVVSRASASITRYVPAPNGNLSFQSCRANTNSEGCDGLDDQTLEGASDVAVSPDSETVYVVSTLDGSITWWDQATGGNLTNTRCYVDAPIGTCLLPEDQALNGAVGVTVSPDGRSVYVASDEDDSISHFSRAANGDLDYQNCFADTATDGCSVPAHAALAGATDVAVSPKGDSVFVVSVIAGSISRFTREADGDLSFRECIAETAADGCAVNPALKGASGIAVSRDGKSVYATGQGADAISHIALAADGKLSFRGCLAETSALGCSVPANAALDGPVDVALSPGDESVYVAAQNSDSITDFTRDLGLVRCAGRPATRVGGAGRDVISGTGRPDVIAALGGNDLIRALAGNDVVCGGAGNDRIAGGKGRDRLLGQAGRDRLLGGPGRDLLLGGPRRDLLLGGPGRDRQRQ